MASATKAVIEYCKKEPLECLGALLGGLGAFLLSQNQNYSRFGWVAFLLSNLCLIRVARQKNMHGLLLVQMYFTFTSLNGLSHYF